MEEEIRCYGMVNGEIPDIWRREQRAVVGGQLEVSSLYKTAAT